VKINAVIDPSGEGRRPEARVTIRAEGFEIDIDTSSLAQALADIGAAQLTEAVRTGSVKASKATIRARKARGISSDRLFYATGNLARNIKAEPAGDGKYDIVAPPGYLQEEKLVDAFEEHILNNLFAGRGFEIAIDTEIEDIVGDLGEDG
jgi:hypothetical protein